MGHAIRFLISSLVVLVYATAAVVGVHAEMLCIGTDGHIAFEGAAGTDDCHGETAQGGSSHMALSDIDEACCTDFALPGRAALKAKDSPNVLVYPLVVVWTFFRNVPSEATFPVSVTTFDARASSARTLTSHQSAILLI